MTPELLEKQVAGLFGRNGDGFVAALVDRGEVCVASRSLSVTDEHPFS